VAREGAWPEVVPHPSVYLRKEPMCTYYKGEGSNGTGEGRERVGRGGGVPFPSLASARGPPLASSLPGDGGGLDFLLGEGWK
jgi:hypothetical protein